MSITWAAVLGAGARLRPILMTSLAMVVGLLPLMFAFGVGAHGNRTLGTASIGGMLIGMICQIFHCSCTVRNLPVLTREGETDGMGGY